MLTYWLPHVPRNCSLFGLGVSSLRRALHMRQERETAVKIVAREKGATGPRGGW